MEKMFKIDKDKIYIYNIDTSNYEPIELDFKNGDKCGIMYTRIASYIMENPYYKRDRIDIPAANLKKPSIELESAILQIIGNCIRNTNFNGVFDLNSMNEVYSFWGYRDGNYNFCNNTNLLIKAADNKSPFKTFHELQDHFNKVAVVNNNGPTKKI